MDGEGDVVPGQFLELQRSPLLWPAHGREDRTGWVDSSRPRSGTHTLEVYPRQARPMLGEFRASDAQPQGGTQVFTQRGTVVWF